MQAKSHISINPCFIIKLPTYKPQLEVHINGVHEYASQSGKVCNPLTSTYSAYFQPSHITFQSGAYLTYHSNLFSSCFPTVSAVPSISRTICPRTHPYLVDREMAAAKTAYHGVNACTICRGLILR